MDCSGTCGKSRYQHSVIVWGAAFSEAEALRFLQAGAAGVVRKTATLEALLELPSRGGARETWMDEQMLRESDGRCASGIRPSLRVSCRSWSWWSAA